jgi:DNA-binding GntR family transcriptional regulator
MELKAIKAPQSLSRIAYDTLKKAILDGRLRPGQVYNEMVLARELRISRTPVREALLELSTLGFVRFLPRRGVMVNQYTELDIIEIIEVRKAVETLAVEKACSARTQEDLARMLTLLNDQRVAVQNGDRLTYMKADRMFHLLLAQLTGNKRLLSIVENMREMFHSMGLSTLDKDGRMETVISEHQIIYEAIARVQPHEARLAMSTHLEQSQFAAIEQLRLRKMSSPVENIHT